MTSSPKDSLSPSVSGGPVEAAGTRAISPAELADRIRMRISGIESTVRLVTASGELADYDDECANDLHYAVEYLKQAQELLAAPSPSPVPTDDGLEMAARVFEEDVAEQAARLGVRPKENQSPGFWMMAVRLAAIRALKSNSNSLPAPAIEDGERWPQAGDKMRFLGENGYESQLKKAKGLFIVGNLYTVKNCEVGDWNHYVEFEEVVGRYNGVMFERVVIVPANLLQSTTPPAASPGQVPDGWMLVPKEPDDKLAEQFCFLNNWSPDGTENRLIDGEWYSITFRELAKSYYRQFLTATPQAPSQVDGWLPIESAPKDGTWMLGCDSTDGLNSKYSPIIVMRWRKEGSWRDAGWYTDGGAGFQSCEPSHWRPLPEPPAALSDASGEE